MTGTTAIQLIEEVKRAGGRVTVRLPDTLSVDLPRTAMERLAPLLKAAKPELLRLLAKPEGPCPACRTTAWRQDFVGAWLCAACLPDLIFGPLPADPEEAESQMGLRARLREPRYGALTIASPISSGNLRVLMIAAASVVWAAAGSEEIARRRAAAWVGIPASLIARRRISFLPAPGAVAVGEWVRTHRGAAAEVLAHDAASGAVLARTIADPPRWGWLAPATLVSELDWPLGGK
ncbi:MAG: hypothetical protein ACRD1C_01915 [Terriglobales bacterium]